MPAFEQGTLAIAKSVAKATSSGAFSLIGGGDSVAAIKKFNLQNSVFRVLCLSVCPGRLYSLEANTRLERGKTNFI